MLSFEGQGKKGLLYLFCGLDIQDQSAQTSLFVVLIIKKNGEISTQLNTYCGTISIYKGKTQMMSKEFGL